MWCVCVCAPFRKIVCEYAWMCVRVCVFSSTSVCGFLSMSVCVCVPVKMFVSLLVSGYIKGVDSCPLRLNKACLSNKRDAVYTSLLLHVPPLLPPLLSLFLLSPPSFILFLSSLMCRSLSLSHFLFFHLYSSSLLFSPLSSLLPSPPPPPSTLC